jgi:hypothetical protein
MISDKKTVLQNFLDWLRLNQEENSDAIGKVLSMIELERSQIEDSFHQAQLEMIRLMEQYIGIKSEVDSEDKEDAQEYYRTRYMFNDNIIGESKN